MKKQIILLLDKDYSFADIGCIVLLQFMVTVFSY